MSPLPDASAQAAFCRRHFSWKGAWRLNRAALGWDLLRAPCNVFFAPIWLLLQLLSTLLSLCGAKRLAQLLRATPPGLRTQVHQRIRSHILQELIPGRQDALSQRILLLNIDRYLAARTASAEISANLLVLLSGALLFGQLTPGGLGWGRSAAEAISLHAAIQNFWAGGWLGQLWFGWFPPDTPLWLSLLCIAAALSLIALTAALAGVFTDPLQQAVGLQRARLRRLLQGIQTDLDAAQAQGWKPPEPLLARVFDLLDWLKLGA